MTMPEDTICLELEKSNPHSDLPLRANVYDHSTDLEHGDEVPQIEFDDYFDLLQTLDADDIELEVQVLPEDRKVLHIYVNPDVLEEIDQDRYYD